MTPPWTKTRDLFAATTGDSPTEPEPDQALGWAWLLPLVLASYSWQIPVTDTWCSSGGKACSLGSKSGAARPLGCGQQSLAAQEGHWEVCRSAPNLLTLAPNTKKGKHVLYVLLVQPMLLTETWYFGSIPPWGFWMSIPSIYQVFLRLHVYTLILGKIQGNLPFSELQQTISSLLGHKKHMHRQLQQGNWYITSSHPSLPSCDHSLNYKANELYQPWSFFAVLFKHFMVLFTPCNEQEHCGHENECSTSTG